LFLTRSMHGCIVERVARTVVATVLIVAGIVIGGSAASGPSVSLQIKRSAIVYGQEVVLRGRAPNARARERLTVLAHMCSFSGAVPIRTLRASRSGAFSFRIGPTLNTAYVVAWGKHKSRRVTVRVAPNVDLDPQGNGQFRMSVAAGGGSSFAKKRALLQRHVGNTWRTIRSATLALVSPPDALTSVSTGTVSARLPRGTKLRAVLPLASAKPCYSPGISSVVTP
jgi:hypothetical protein